MKRIISVLSVAALMAMMTAAPAFALSLTTPEVPSQTVELPDTEVGADLGADVDLGAGAELSIGLP